PKAKPPGRMMASQPGICSERCHRNSTCSPRTAPTAWYASSSQFEPGNTTTPNFIARNLPEKILAHQQDCLERRNSGKEGGGSGTIGGGISLLARRICDAGAPRVFLRSRDAAQLFSPVWILIPAIWRAGQRPSRV